ncbi:LysR family transcriptional regulator [Zooshikella sp. RANM57]|uniref:LysR family transcriptional regulator n=1 Tax=Zooshikella sp. RANM57 TaxID=3425863 RepID=UPI003D6F82CD
MSHRRNHKKPLAYRMLVFAEVVRQGSFTAAAEVLGHSKSAVSTYISELEQLVGVRLLNRSTRSLNLTTVGQQFAVRCQAMDTLIETALDEVVQQADIPQGPIRITAPEVFAEEVLVPVINQLCQQYPELQPELVFSDERLDLMKHKLDLAISVGELKDSNYRAIKIGSLTSVLVASPKLGLSNEKWGADNIEGYRKIITSWQRKTQIFDENTGCYHRFFTSSHSVLVNNLPGALALAIQGTGIALLPKLFVKRAVEDGLLEILSPNLIGEKRDIYAVHAYEKQLPYIFRVMIQQLKMHLAMT